MQNCRRAFCSYTLDVWIIAKIVKFFRRIWYSINCASKWKTGQKKQAPTTSKEWEIQIHGKRTTANTQEVMIVSQWIMFFDWSSYLNIFRLSVYFVWCGGLATANELFQFFWYLFSSISFVFSILSQYFLWFNSFKRTEPFRMFSSFFFATELKELSLSLSPSPEE